MCHQLASDWSAGRPRVVQVIAGSDKGKVGKITKVLTKTGQVVVEDVNIKVGGGGTGAGGREGAGGPCPVFAAQGWAGGLLLWLPGRCAPALPLTLCQPACLICCSPLPWLQTKHVKPTAEGESGQIVKAEYPVHHSNVQHYSTEKQVGGGGGGEGSGQAGSGWQDWRPRRACDVSIRTRSARPGSRRAGLTFTLLAAW